MSPCCRISWRCHHVVGYLCTYKTKGFSKPYETHGLSKPYKTKGFSKPCEPKCFSKPCKTWGLSNPYKTKGSSNPYETKGFSEPKTYSSLQDLHSTPTLTRHFLCNPLRSHIPQNRLMYLPQNYLALPHGLKPLRPFLGLTFLVSFQRPINRSSFSI